MRTRLIMGAVASLALVGLGACSASQDIGTEPGTSRSTTAGDAPSTPGSSGSSPGSLPEGCHEAPASTALGLPGGGEIVCDDPDAAVSSPPMDPGQTTIPDTTAPITTMAGQGVLQGWATGGLDCAPDEACPAIAMIMSGTVTTTAADGTATTATIDPMGGWALALGPGEYTITVAADTGRCDTTSATVVAGQVTEVGLTCLVPRD